MENYFNTSSSSLTHNFFGTPMQLVPEHNRNFEQATQRHINEHTKLQRDDGKNLERIDVSG